MDSSYASLLEKTRVPQPSLQKFAVISIFDKLRTAPPHHGLDSEPGRAAVSYCLHSNSAFVVEVSVRELCWLVKDSKMELSRGLLELQSALEEASDPRFVNVFVKAIGFLVQLGFRNRSFSLRFRSSENHPFVKILSCRSEVQRELVQQLGLFMVKNKHLGMDAVCDFLRPFLNYSIIQMSVLVRFRSFVRSLVTSLASLCCSFSSEAVPVIKLLMECLKFFPSRDPELVEMGLLSQEEVEDICEIARHILVVQKELGLNYVPEFSSVMLSLFLPLIQSELEQEQLAVLKLVLFLVEWKIESDVDRFPSELSEELLFIFPVINIASSPSKSVKQVATVLLSSLEKRLIALSGPPKEGPDPQTSFCRNSSPGCIIYRFLQHLWYQKTCSSSFLFNLDFASAKDINDVGQKVYNSWTYLRDCLLLIVNKKKSAQTLSKSQGIFISEISFSLAAIASVCLMHQKLRNSSVEILAFIGNVNPELGLPLMLFILLCNRLTGKDGDTGFCGISLKILGLLPSLASHPAMMPLIVQTILPMLHKDVKPVLYATAVRLICKTWEINDRVFGNLQGVLIPSKFVELAMEKDICISMAASVLDVCRKNPDRGVDLVLSVEACIENEDNLVQSLGLQSLAHLCEADVIDFYTAWDVIKKHVSKYKTNAVVTYGLCILLRWGAMDAEAYPEVSSHILNILWEVGTSRTAGHGPSWAKTRAMAFQALTAYEVVHILRSFPNFKEVNLDFLISETDPEVLRVLEGFESKLIDYEFINRRSFARQKRESKNKIEKLLDVLPQVIFPRGDESKVKEIPGAALLLLNFAPDLRNRGPQKELEEMNAKFENVMVEIASSLKLSRNVLVALVSLQSWKPFMRRWVKVQLKLLGAKPHSSVLDNTSKAANNILKILRRKADECIPSSAENFGLAIGALCSVLPQPVHVVKSSASKFLCSWLLQHEHEYRQWTAAISLGLVSSCLHVTDRKQKFENIDVLLKVASSSKSTLVKGACGVGLGFSCESLLTSVGSEGNSSSERESYKTEELEVLRNIITVLSNSLCQFTESSADILRKLPSYIPLAKYGSNQYVSVESVNDVCGDLEEDIWGVTGLILGLGSSISAVYRSGAREAVINIKDWILSCILYFNSSIERNTSIEKRDMVLSAGSCLALPVVVAFCQRVELIDSTEVDRLVSSLKELISELVSVEQLSTFAQSLLIASSVGAGNFLSSILNGGIYSLKVEDVKDLLSLCRKIYSSPRPPLVHFGGMLGVISLLGASVGLPDQYITSTQADIPFDQKMESSRIMGPLLSIPLVEPELTLSVREIFLAAQESDDHQFRQFAAWAISLLRDFLWFKQPQNEEITFQEDAISSVRQGLPKDSLVVKISTWLMHLDLQTATISHATTVFSALRCLSYAPRLPMLDWGAIIRRCMRLEDLLAKSLALDSSMKKGYLREECLLFSLCHANQIEPLLVFINELSELSRFKTLDKNLQSCFLLHLADLIKIFSGSRLEKLFEDIINFMLWVISSQKYSQEEKSFLRTSCWKGLSFCLGGDSLHVQECVAYMEKCMKVLFDLLPAIDIMEPCSEISEEFSEAVSCLGKSNQRWLLDLLQTPEASFMEENRHFSESVKKIRAKARLVRIGSLTLTELGKLRPYFLNLRSEVMWNVLTEVAAALQHAEENVKVEWLLETLQISCVTSYPSTALQLLGLLCGNWCKYMPILVMDKYNVLRDLPITLTSFLRDSSLGNLSESVFSSLWTLTERIYGWVTGDSIPNQQSIDRSENDASVFLLFVLHRACVLLKDCLPLDKQIELANMVIP
ncbi:OLC1v1011710C1 [Oldenlandia corymbosa var. corymbosa]|uniref:OLC1v1011710C1 n=1 Tax=Oldenlandia corymbosa var. corymbosa TaxID=529605 RepID=A0AAV1DW19_OLDCO|nr:OLC1v1011710C1 [Oldenlandia corymbosa var. corymbosa]